MGLIGCEKQEEERRRNRKFVLWVRRPNVAPHYVLVGSDWTTHPKGFFIDMPFIRRILFSMPLIDYIIIG